MDLKVQTAELAAFEGRVAGSDAERRAAGHLRDRLAAAGRTAELEPVRVRPRWAAAQAIAAAVAMVGSVVSVSSPGLGMALVLAATLSSVVEVAGGFHVLRHLTGSRASQNVSSPGGRDRRGVLLLVAGYDAPRDATFTRLAHGVRDPWLIVSGSMLAVLVCCAIRLLGFEGNGLTALQLVPTLALLAAVPLLVEVELSPPTRGEPEAAAAAAVVSLAEDLRDELRHLDVWVVVAGAGAALGQGMRAWLRRHRGELDPERTAVVAIEALGTGGVRYTTREGTLLLSWRTSRDLAGICRDIAADDEDGAAFDAQPLASRDPGGAVAALSRGLPAIGITTASRAEADPHAAERARAFCAELARRIDSELAPRIVEQPLRRE